MIQNKEHLMGEKNKISDALLRFLEMKNSPLVLFVHNNAGKILGSITDGDVRRGLLKGLTLNDCVTQVMCKTFKFIDDLRDHKKIEHFKKMDLKLVPLLDKNGKLKEFLDLTVLRAILPVDAVIMAGGKGVRLSPFTDDTPKPMLPLKGKPIIAHNIDRLLLYGIKNIYISVNHLKDQIIDYVSKNYAGHNIYFIEEKEALGTIGSLSLVKKFTYNDVLVMNADLLTTLDYADFFEHYKKNKAKMSVATFNIRINLPYAVLKTNGSSVKSLEEKPTYTHYSNAGIYLLNSSAVSEIPKSKKFDSTDLLEKLVKQKKKVSHFLICGYWLDIGNAQNYMKAKDDIAHIKF